MNMNKGSMIDYAIAILTTQKAMTFAELWAKVKEELESPRKKKRTASAISTPI